MRTPTFIRGFKNSQRIRVIVDNVGFYTTVAGTADICTHHHAVATQMALMNLAHSRREAERKHDPEVPVGFGFNYTNVDGTVTPVQVDLA